MLKIASSIHSNKEDDVMAGKRKETLRSIILQKRMPSYKIHRNCVERETLALDRMLASGELMGYSCCLSGDWAEIVPYQGAAYG